MLKLRWITQHNGRNKIEFSTQVEVSWARKILTDDSLYLRSFTQIRTRTTCKAVCAMFYSIQQQILRSASAQHFTFINNLYVIKRVITFLYSNCSPIIISSVVTAISSCLESRLLTLQNYWLLDNLSCRLALS